MKAVSTIFEAEARLLWKFDTAIKNRLLPLQTDIWYKLIWFILILSYKEKSFDSCA